MMLMPLILIAIMYFLMIRPQMKRAKEHRSMLDALNKGDEVLTNGGLAGVVTDIGDELSSFLSGLPSDADELDKLLSRQGELKALVRKYAPDIDGVIEWRETAERRLSEIDDPQGSIDELEAAAATARCSPSTTGPGVCAGSSTPNHSSAVRSGWPSSAKVGTSGRTALRVAPVVATARSLPSTCPVR